MINKILACLLGSLLVVGCSQRDVRTPTEDFDTLHQRFHGKYEIVSSTSSEAIDVNLDGRTSVDMFQEYPYLKQHYLQLSVYGPNKYNPDRAFIFTQWWPEQYLQLPSGQEWTGDVIAYEPGTTTNFAMQGSSRSFDFSSDLKTLLVRPNEGENSFRWHRPESVVVNASDYITTVNVRRLYTSSGVKEVTITTIYKRYTTIT